MTQNTDNNTTTTTTTTTTDAKTKTPKTVKLNKDKFASWKLGIPTTRSLNEGFDGTRPFAEFDAKDFRSDAYRNIAEFTGRETGRFSYAPQRNYDAIQKLINAELPKGHTVRLRYVARQFSLKIFRSDDIAGTFRLFPIDVPIDRQSLIATAKRDATKKG